MKPARNAKEIHPNLFLAIFTHRILVSNHINGSSLPLKLHGFLPHRDEGSIRNQYPILM